MKWYLKVPVPNSNILLYMLKLRFVIEYLVALQY